MRFNNPIKNHKFLKFKDIASHKELIHEYRNDRNIYLKPLENSLKNKNLKKFNNYLDNVINETKRDRKICNQEIKESNKFRNKLSQYFNIYKNFNVKSKKINSVIFKDLYDKGYHVCNLNLKEIINKDIDNKYSELCKRKDWTPPPGTHDRWLELNKASVKKIDKIFRDNGLIKASEAYYSKKMRVTRVRMTVHRPTDKAWKQFLYDCKSTTKHTGLHIDPLEGVTKAIIYLDKVKKTTGPTLYLQNQIDIFMIHFNRYLQDLLLPAAGVIIKFQGEQFSDYQKNLE